MSSAWLSIHESICSRCIRLSGFRQGFAEKAQKIPGEKSAHIFARIAALIEKAVKLLQVRNCFNPHRRLLGAKSTIQIAANANMVRISCDLTDVIDVVERI